MVECHNFLSGKGSLWLLSVHFLSKPSTSYTKIYHDHLLHWQQKQLEAESGKVNEKPFGKYHPISALHYTISSSIQQQLQSLKLVISNESILWKYVEHPVNHFLFTNFINLTNFTLSKYILSLTHWFVEMWSYRMINFIFGGLSSEKYDGVFYQCTKYKQNTCQHPSFNCCKPWKGVKKFVNYRQLCEKIREIDNWAILHLTEKNRYFPLIKGFDIHETVEAEKRMKEKSLLVDISSDFCSIKWSNRNLDDLETKNEIGIWKPGSLMSHLFLKMVNTVSNGTVFWLMIVIIYRGKGIYA